LLNNQPGSVLNEFTFAARSTSVFSGSESLVIRFSLADSLNPTVKFDPRFYLLDYRDSMESARVLHLQRAWLSAIGVFLFPAPGLAYTPKVLFVSRTSPNFVALKAVLKRLQAWETPEKPSLSAYFWRMNVLR
jgi:hypothetical protein